MIHILKKLNKKAKIYIKDLLDRDIFEVKIPRWNKSTKPDYTKTEKDKIPFFNLQVDFYDNDKFKSIQKFETQNYINSMFKENMAKLDLSLINRNKENILNCIHSTNDINLISPLSALESRKVLYFQKIILLFYNSLIQIK